MAPAALKEDRSRGRASTVLVAEDDALLAGQICQALRRTGIHAEAVADGRSTIDRLRDGGASLLLLDVHLPDMEGMDVIESLQRSGDEIPFLIISGAAEAAIAVEYMRRGARDYLVKNANLADIVPEVVQRTLDDIARDEQLSRLQREILEISEREQRRIGQDLHDDVCQRLAAIKMQIQHLEGELEQKAPEVLEQMHTVSSRLGEATRVARALARGLSPVDIGHEGLPAALGGLARNSEDIFQVTCEFKTVGQCPTLEHHVSTQFYRIAQDAIAHEVKNGKADHIQMTLLTEDGRLILSLSSNAQMRPRSHRDRGLDLYLIRHRAESIGATLRFQPLDSHGSTSAIEVSYPLP